MKMLREWNGTSNDLLIEALAEFGIGAKEIRIHKYEAVTPDSFIWFLMVKQGGDWAFYYLYAEDYVPSIEHVADMIKQNFTEDTLGDTIELVPVLRSVAWDKSEPVTSVEHYVEPENPTEFMKYALPSGYDFVFLAKVVDTKQGDIQKILDRAGGLGRVLSISVEGEFFITQTNQGTLIIYSSQDDLEAIRKREVNIESLVKDKYGDCERILLPDYKEELEPYASYIHYRDKYYSIYRLTRLVTAQ